MPPVTSKVDGTLTYPCPPPQSCQSGRIIDDEHWKKVESIFPVEYNPNFATTDQEEKKPELQLNDTSQAYHVGIWDGRVLKPALDKEGFTLATSLAQTGVSDFANTDEVERVYLEEVKTTIKSAFAGSSSPPVAIIPFHWLVRDSRRDNYDSSKGPSTYNGTSHAPVSRVHGDYTVENGPLRFDELQAKGLIPSSWDKTTAHWGIVNVWRNIDEEPIGMKPLAVLDVSSVPKEDVFQYWLVNGGRIGRNLAVTYHDQHRWMYFPKMTNTEALVFFTFESNCGSDNARTVFHTAFDLPPADMGESPRSRVSIETRSLVVFDPKVSEE